jgi:hypothetical protein
VPDYSSLLSPDASGNTDPELRELVRKPWEAPQLTEFGPITGITQGKGFAHGDGINNLS